MKIYCNTKSEFLNKLNDELDFIIFSPQICKHVAKVSFGSNYFCRTDNANFGAFILYDRDRATVPLTMFSTWLYRHYSPGNCYCK